MTNAESSLFFSEWAEEINLSILNNKSLCLAVFSCQRELIYVNSPMHILLKDAPFEMKLFLVFRTPEQEWNRRSLKNSSALKMTFPKRAQPMNPVVD